MIADLKELAIARSAVIAVTTTNLLVVPLQDRATSCPGLPHAPQLHCAELSALVRTFALKRAQNPLQLLPSRPTALRMTETEPARD